MSTAYTVSDEVIVEGTGAVPGKIELSDGTNAVSLSAAVGLATTAVSLPTTAGIAGQGLKLLSATTSEWADMPVVNIWYISDVKPTGTNGGILPAGWIARVLNTIVTTPGATTDVQLAVAPAVANQILIQPGTYRVTSIVPYSTTTIASQCRVYNITDAVVEVSSMNAQTRDWPSIAASTLLFLDGTFVVAGAAKVYEIQQYGAGGGASGTDLGYPLGLGGYLEIYTQVTITKIL